MYSYGPHLLLPYNHAGAPHWENLDSQELYAYNSKTQPKSWPWHRKPVTYTWNSNGYRCSEWTDINWSQANVIMGCSYVMGLGIDDSETISAGIDQGVNLGQCGINVYNIQYNSLRLIDAGLRPRSVKIIIPDLTRAVYWGDIDWIDLTPHDFEIRGDKLIPAVRNYYQGLLAIKPMAEHAAYMSIRATQALWTSVGVSCDLYHHWCPIDPKFIMAPILPEPVDLARDLQNGFAHPGPKTMDIWRSVIYENHI